MQMRTRPPAKAAPGSIPVGAIPGKPPNVVTNPIASAANPGHAHRNMLIIVIIMPVVLSIKFSFQSKTSLSIPLR
jgi:hypothetical protein